MDTTGRATWAVERHAEWEVVSEALTERGWTVEITCPAAPVQVEGRLPCGEAYYFRARWNEAEMSVGGDDPIDAYHWQGSEVVPGSNYEASYLSGPQGQQLLLRLESRYLEEWAGQTE